MRAVMCLFAVCVGLAPPCRADDDWQSLFNGKDLSGWRANNDPESFTVKDGVLRVQASAGNAAHLFFVGDQKNRFEAYKDFELEAIVKAEPNSNCGIFIHTDLTTRDAQKHLAQGYEGS